MLEDTDYVILEINDCCGHGNNNLRITMEMNYSNKTINYQKLQNLHTPIGRVYKVDDVHRMYRGDVTQFLDASLLDDTIDTGSPVESFVITHGLLLRVIENNRVIFGDLLKKEYIKRELELLKYSSRNIESISNIKAYHEIRLKNYMRRLDMFLV